MNEIAIVMTRGKYQEGAISGEHFVPYEEDHDGEIPDTYILLHDFLKLTNPKQTKKESEVVRKKIGFTKIWIYVKDNDDFWAHFNHKCNTCTKTCKQSSKVEIIACPSYDEIVD